MENIEDNMYMGKKTQYFNNINSPQSGLYILLFAIKIPAGYFPEI